MPSSTAVISDSVPRSSTWRARSIVAVEKPKRSDISNSVTEIRERLADHFSLSQEDLEAQIPSGRAKLFANRVGWATTHLYQSGLIERPRRSVYRITRRGQEILAQHPSRVDLKVLSQFAEFHEFRGKTSTTDPAPGTSEVEPHGPEQTPEEQIDAAYRLLRAALAAEALDRVMEQSPSFFEQLVLDVLRAMRYGGSREDAVARLGQSGDEGVDGVIREDELGLDLIYVQAKRWQNPVGRPEIQKFFGALHGKRASKGVFITTSSFTSEAATYAESVTPRVILLLLVSKQREQGPHDRLEVGHSHRMQNLPRLTPRRGRAEINPPIGEWDPLSEALREHVLGARDTLGRGLVPHRPASNGSTSGSTPHPNQHALDEAQPHGTWGFRTSTNPVETCWG